MPDAIWCVGAFRKRQKATTKCCPACGYDIRSLTTPQCPECGTNLGLTGYITLPMDTALITIKFIGWLFIHAFLGLFGLILFGVLANVPGHYLPYADFQRMRAFELYWDDYLVVVQWVEEDTGWHLPGTQPSVNVNRITIGHLHQAELLDDDSIGYFRSRGGLANANLFLDVERRQHWIGQAEPPSANTLYDWPMEPSSATGLPVADQTAEIYFTTILGQAASTPEDIKAQNSFRTILNQIKVGLSIEHIRHPNLTYEITHDNGWYAFRHGERTIKIIAWTPVILGVMIVLWRTNYMVRKGRLKPKFCKKVTEGKRYL